MVDVGSTDEDSAGGQPGGPFPVAGQSRVSPALFNRIFSATHAEVMAAGVSGALPSDEQIAGIAARNTRFFSDPGPFFRPAAKVAGQAASPPPLPDERRPAPAPQPPDPAPLDLQPLADRPSARASYPSNPALDGDWTGRGAPGPFSLPETWAGPPAGDRSRSADPLADLLSVVPSQSGGQVQAPDAEADDRLVPSSTDPKNMTQRDVAIAVYQTTRRLGATPAQAQWLVSVANKEASLKLTAHNKTHFGLFQFDAAKWREHGGGADVYDLESQVRFALDDLRPRMDKYGDDPTTAGKKAYVLHQQGSGGGPALLNAAPGTTAVAALGKFYKRGGAVGAIRSNLLKALRPRAATISAQEFLQVLYDSFDRKQDEALRIMRSQPHAASAPSTHGRSGRRVRGH